MRNLSLNYTKDIISPVTRVNVSSTANRMIGNKYHRADRGRICVIFKRITSALNAEKKPKNMPAPMRLFMVASVMQHGRMK